MKLYRTITTAALLCSLWLTASAQNSRVGARLEPVEKPQVPVITRADARINQHQNYPKDLFEQRIERVKIDARPDEAVFSFHLNQATVPIVEVGKRAPEANLSFRPGYVVSVVFPVLGGKRQDHKLLLRNLKPGTLYHYVITAASNDNKLVKVTGTFTTPVPLSNPQGNPARN